MPWLMTLPGPGKPATLLMPGFAVAAIQNVVAPSGNCGSGAPVATMVGRKHSRSFVSVQLPASTPMFTGSQSALLLHVMKKSPFALRMASQPLSAGAFWP